MRYNIAGRLRANTGLLQSLLAVMALNGCMAADLELLDEAGTNWVIPSGVTSVSVLVVGGGGGGAPGLGNAGGGGGAGGLVFVDNYLKKFNAKPGDVIEVRVGLPGPIVSMALGRRGLSGTNSCFGKIIALGGGGGGRGGYQLQAIHHASSGGSAGGGMMGSNAPVALQPAASGFGIGFGHPGGVAGGGGGGGAGGPGTLVGKGGGGIGLQGIPKDIYMDKATGCVTGQFDATNSAHYKFLFRDLLGPGVGDDGWFAGGGAFNQPNTRDRGGRGGGSLWDALPHTGGGGGGSCHGYQGGDPGIGGSGVVLIRYQFAGGAAKTRGWGRVQPEEFVAKAVLKEPAFLCSQGKYDEAIATLEKAEKAEALPNPVRVQVLRLYGQIYAGMGRDKDSLSKFKAALEMEKK
jgi:hypothetical protein